MRAWKKKKGTNPQLQTTNVKKSKGKKKVVAENDEAAKAARKGKNKLPVEEEEDVESSDSEDDSSMSSVSSSSSSSSASSSDSSSSSDDSSSSSDSSSSDSGDSSSSSDSDSDDSSSDSSNDENIESPVMKSKKLKKKKRVPSVLQIVSKKSWKKIPRSRPPARSRSLSRTRSRSIGRPADSREEEHTVTNSRSRSNGRPPLGITRSFGNIRKVASRLGRVGQRHSRHENGDNLSQFSEDNEAVAAADAFGRDMKKLGYNLSYDSFLSKGSSATEDVERDERYAPVNTQEKTREESHERYLQKDTIDGRPSSTRNDYRAHYEPKNIKSNETDSEVGAFTGTSLDSRLSSLQITVSTGDFSHEGELEICMSDVTNTSEKLRAESVRPTSSASRRLIRPPSPEDGSQLVVTASGIQEFTRNAASRRIPETSDTGKAVIRAPVSTKHGNSQAVYKEQPTWAKMLNMETFTPKSQNTVAAMSAHEGEPMNSSGTASSPCSLSRNSRPSSVPPRRKLSHEPSRRNTDTRGHVQTVSKGDGRVSSLTNESNFDQESFSLPPKRNMAPSSPPVVIQGIHEIVRNDSHDPKPTSPIFIEGMSFMEQGVNESQLVEGEFQDDGIENAPASSVPKRSRNRRRRSWFPSRTRTSKGKKSAKTVDPILDDRPAKASQLEIVGHETDLDAKEQFDSDFDRVVQKIPGAKSPKRGSKSPLRKVANLLTPGSAKRDSKPMDTTPEALHNDSTAVTTGPFATPATEAPAPEENGEVLGEKHFFGPNFESKEVETKTVASGRQSCSTAGKTMLTQHERIEVEIDEDAKKQAKKRGPRPLFSFLRKKQTDEADRVKVSVEEAPKKKGKKTSKSQKQELSENGQYPLDEEKRVPADTANVLGPSTRHGPNATKPSPTSAHGDKGPTHSKMLAKDQEALTDGIPPPVPVITIDEEENTAMGDRREKITAAEGPTSAQATGRSRRGIPHSPRAHNAPDTALAKTFGDFINVLFDKNQKTENSSTTTTSAFGFGIGACGVPMCTNDSTAIEVVKHEELGSHPVLRSQEACANRSRRVLGVTDYGIDDIDEKSHTSSSVKVTLAKPLPPPPQRRGNEVEKITTESQEAGGKLLPFFKRQNKGGSRAGSKEPLEIASKKQSSKASKSSSKMSKASSKKSKKNSEKKAANSDYSWRSNLKDHKKSQKATPSNPPAMEIQTGGTYDGSTLTSLPDGAYQHRAKGADQHIKGVRSPLFSLESDDDSMGHTWAEIADASLVVERAINKIETMKSDDTDTSRKIKNLLSNDTDTDGAATADVEQALQVLRKHADRLGVRESDLLLAVKSEDIESVEEVSVRSLTFTEEVMEAFNMYLKTPR